MSTASLALRQKHRDACDRSAPDDEDEPRIYTADDIISLMRRYAYAASNAQMTSLEVQARVIVGELSAEAYNAGRLDGLLAMGGERETQFLKPAQHTIEHDCPWPWRWDDLAIAAVAVGSILACYFGVI